MEFKRTGLMLAFAGVAALAGAPTEVSACGGCFSGPQTVQVVTDHRMVLSISGTQTTLWDQFQYTGQPADFSWILPIRYTERSNVAIADDGFMRMADGLTAPIVTPPNRPFCGRGVSAPTAAGAADASAREDDGVTVLRQQIVGPYAVSIIRGTDAMAIRNWLGSNGYTVTPPVEPIIDYYTSLNMDYIALRLRPGEGINRMSPVRVTLEGTQPVLPLRMIAAGVADRVGLSLVVIAPSRFEAMNFPNGEIREADLTYDFSRPGSPSADFLAAFNALNRANSGRLWLTESATRQNRADWEAAAPGYRAPAVTPGGPGGRDAGPPPPADAGADDGGTPPTDPVDDVRVAFSGLGDGAVVTRMRADLLGSMLSQDLRLQSSDRALRARNYTYGRLLNDPGPTCSGGGVIPDGGVVLSDAGPSGGTSEGGIHCSARPGPAKTFDGFMAAVAGLMAAGLGLRARRRSR